MLILPQIAFFSSSQGPNPVETNGYSLSSCARSFGPLLSTLSKGVKMNPMMTSSFPGFPDRGSDGGSDTTPRCSPLGQEAHSDAHRPADMQAKCFIGLPFLLDDKQQQQQQQQQPASAGRQLQEAFLFTGDDEETVAAAEEDEEEEAADGRRGDTLPQRRSASSTVLSDGDLGGSSGGSSSHTTTVRRICWAPRRPFASASRNARSTSGSAGGSSRGHRHSKSHHQGKKHRISSALMTSSPTAEMSHKSRDPEPNYFGGDCFASGPRFDCDGLAAPQLPPLPEDFIMRGLLQQHRELLDKQERVAAAAESAADASVLAIAGGGEHSSKWLPLSMTGLELELSKLPSLRTRAMNPRQLGVRINSQARRSRLRNLRKPSLASMSSHHSSWGSGDDDQMIVDEAPSTPAGTPSLLLSAAMSVDDGVTGSPLAAWNGPWQLDQLQNRPESAAFDWSSMWGRGVKWGSQGGPDPCVAPPPTPAAAAAAAAAAAGLTVTGAADEAVVDLWGRMSFGHFLHHLGSGGSTACCNICASQARAQVKA